MSASSPETAASHGSDGDRKTVARGAGLAVLGRLGALVEAASFPLFLSLYGAVAFGAYATIWAVARIATGVTVMGMDVAIQRFAPALDDEAAVHRALKIALLTSLSTSLAASLAMSTAATSLTGLAEHGAADTEALVGAIRLFAWSLPFWSGMEVLTAAVRARRKFGPEIRIRSFYEPLARIVFAVGFAWAGASIYGLFLAHFLSMALAFVLSLALARRFYDLRLLAAVGRDRGLERRILGYALPMMPANLVIRLFSELPIVMLNALLPGSGGTAAAGYFAIARKVASVLQVVYNAFDYVVTPLAAYREGQADRSAVADMYVFSARMMIAVGLLLAAVLIGGRHLLVAALGPESAPAADALAILAAGRFATFLFGQAAATIRTLGTTLWSLANGLAGLLIMIALIFLLVAPFGAVGAALAAAAGLIVTRGLPCLEVAVIYKITPYSRQLVRPAAAAAALALLLLGLGEAMLSWHTLVQLPVFLLAAVLAPMLLVRYGLSEEDAAALGRLGRVLRRGR